MRRAAFDRKSATIASGEFGPQELKDAADALELVPELAAALEVAERFIKTARHYFPKSVQNGDRFDLENACATVGAAIFKAEGFKK